jgi:hypothetical protein
MQPSAQKRSMGDNLGYTEDRRMPNHGAMIVPTMLRANQSICLSSQSSFAREFYRLCVQRLRSAAGFLLAVASSFASDIAPHATLGLLWLGGQRESLGRTQLNSGWCLLWDGKGDQE